jgi:hypothetical protein
MRIYELKDTDGRVFAFEIDNLWLDRASAAAVVLSIPDARVRVLHASWWGPDEFCRFEVAGHEFTIWEPWGDNSRYWIGPDPPEYSEHIGAVRAAFERHTPRSSQLLRVGVALVGLGISTAVVARHLGLAHGILAYCGLTMILVGATAGGLAIVRRLRGIRAQVHGQADPSGPANEELHQTKR